MPLNSKYRFCGDKDETTNHVISEYSKLTQKSIRLPRLDGEGDPLGIVQEIEIWPYYQMVRAQTRIYPREWDAENSLVIWNTNGSSNPCQKVRPSNNYQKMRICRNVDFTVIADHRIKIKECQ